MNVAAENERYSCGLDKNNRFKHQERRLILEKKKKKYSNNHAKEYVFREVYIAHQIMS